MRRTGLDPLSAHLEPLHRSLKGEYRRPFHGVRMILVIALGLLFFMALRESPQPDGPEPSLYIGGVLEARKPEESAYQKKIQEALEQFRKERAAAAKALAEQEKLPEPVELGEVPEGAVRVAAVQFYPVFAGPELNRERMVPYIRRAAKEGAKVIVFPEAAVPGYAEMNEEVCWIAGESDSDEYVDVTPHAEPADGPSVEFFRPLVRELGIYLTVPIIEVENKRYFSTVLLLAPDGGIALKYRKRQLIPDYDGKWATIGDLGAPVVETPYGRIGVMVSYDVPRTLPELAKAEADLVLWCAAFRGEGVAPLLRAFGARQVPRYDLNVVVANWTYQDAWWQGIGHSRVIRRDGRVVNRAGDPRKILLVIGDVPIHKLPEGEDAPTVDNEAANE